MNCIVVGRNGRPSIRAVATAMNEPVTVYMRRKYESTGETRWFFYDRPRNQWVKDLSIASNGVPFLAPNDVVIRWGYSGPIEGHPHIVQKAHAIDIISNKYESRKILAQHNVPVPKTYNLNNIPANSQQLIARPFYHSRGMDFNVVSNDGDFIPRLGYYYSEIYPKQHEYRVHVAHGKVLLIAEKPLVDGVIQANRAVTHEQWNVLKWSEYDRDVCCAACDAVKAVGANMGGVDIMVNKDNQDMPVCICEINAAPTIKSSEYCVKRYAMYFDWIFRHRGTSHEWDYQDWDVGKSYAWKNEQLAA